MRYAIGVDVGGTHLRVALIDGQGNLLKKEKSQVGSSRELCSFFEEVANLIKAVAGSSLIDLAGIGLGLPGICNQEEGIVYQLPHYPGWRDVKAADLLQKYFSCPVWIDNDANMAALGEHWLGAAGKFSSFIMLTLGTGIGGALFIDGKLYRGESGFAGEVGHMTIEREGPLCPCGKRGCWEMYAGSKGTPKGKTALALSEAADRNDPEAKKFWRHFGEYLAIGIANLAHITDIEHFVLSGGIVNAAPHFLESARAEVQKRSYEKLGSKIRIDLSLLKGDANILGCAAYVFGKSACPAPYDAGP